MSLNVLREVDADDIWTIVRCYGDQAESHMAPEINRVICRSGQLRTIDRLSQRQFNMREPSDLNLVSSPSPARTGTSQSCEGDDVVKFAPNF